MNVPTVLIFMRILCIPLFLVLFFCDWEYGRILSMFVFVFASVTDLFDGIIARRNNQFNAFVKFMDPLADKLLICSALIALVQAHEIPAWFVIIIVCRDFIITGFRMFAATGGRVLGAVVTGKANTAMQMILIVLILGNFSWLGTRPALWLMWFVLVLTVVSTIENFVRNKEVFKNIMNK